MPAWLRLVVSAASVAVSAGWGLAPAGRVAYLARRHSTVDPIGSDVEVVGKKRGRGRPKKESEEVELKKASHRKKPSATTKKPKKLSTQEEADLDLAREITGPSLVIVSADGLPGDIEVTI